MSEATDNGIVGTRGIALVFVAAAAVLVVSLAAVYWMGLVALGSNRQLAQQREVIGHLEKVLSTLKDAETGQRGFLLTGEAGYLEPYRQARAELSGELAELDQLAGAGALPKQQVSEVGRLSGEKLAELEQTIKLNREGNAAAALAIVRSDRGRRLMQQIRSEVAAMEQREVAEFEAAEGRLAHATYARNWTFLAATVMNLAFLVWAYRQVSREIGVRAAAQEELRRNAQRYRSFVEASAQVIWRTNAQGEVDEPIPSWNAFTGQSEQEARAYGWMNVIHPDDRPRVTAAWKAASAAHTLYQVEYRLRRHDGQWLHILARGVPVLASDGQVREYIGTCIDVTEQRQAEATLARERAFVEAVLQACPAGIIVAEPGGKLVRMNPANERLWGLAPFSGSVEDYQEWKGWWADGSARQGRRLQPHEWALARALRGEACPGDIVEIEPFWPPGTRRIMLNSGAPVRGADGEILGAVIVQVDITALKRAEAALRQSEQRFRELADAMPQIVWAARPDGHIDYYNRKWYELTAARGGESGDQSWLPILHPDDRQMCLDKWYESVRTGKAYQLEMRFKFPGSGHYRWHLARALPVRNEAGEIIRWFGTSTDIDDLKRAEDALAQARDNLEQTVAERTAQLAEANANLQAFSYTAAHDLRSPLRSIKSFSSIVVEDYGKELKTEGCSLLERVVGSATQMERLLNDLLEYSQMSQAELKLGPVDLGAAVREALALLDGEVRAKDAAVSVTEPLPKVIGHPATVVLLVNNFVSNALKFMPSGVKPEIRIWAERREQRIDGLMDRWIDGAKTACESGSEHLSNHPSSQQSSEFVRLWVEDNGIGIAEKDLSKIFGAFERLHGKQAYPGTGLGLAIVRKGAERMGGRVGVESEEGKGSRFWVELKAAS